MVAKKFNKVTDGIISLMNEDEKARNSDMWLILRYWQKIEGLNIFIPYVKVDTMTSPETIRRCRQKLNEKGILLPTDPKVRKRRGIRELEVKDWALKK